MKNILRSLLCLLCTITFLLPSATTFAQQQRPRRATDASELQQRVPSGTRILPREHVLILRIETPLDSGKNRPGDRFYARLDDVLTDEENRMIIPANTLFVGHVADVAPAQMRRRSGVIEIVFDKMLTADGRELPIKGVLTSVDSNERKRLKIDDEGVIEGGGQKKKNVVFIGGGAATGAVIGAIVGGAAFGAGVGAAAGLVAVLLSKGKEAIVEPGTRVGLELIEPFDAGRRGNLPVSSNVTQPNNSGINKPSAPIHNNPMNNNPVNNNPQIPNSSTPYTPPQVFEPQILKVSFVQAERVAGGSILVVATAETISSGWQVKTENQVNRDTLEVTIKGIPPMGKSARVASHPTVTTTVEDPSRAIRRVIIHGLDGDRTVNLPLPARR